GLVLPARGGRDVPAQPAPPARAGPRLAGTNGRVPLRCLDPGGRRVPAGPAHSHPAGDAAGGRCGSAGGFGTARAGQGPVTGNSVVKEISCRALSSVSSPLLSSSPTRRRRRPGTGRGQL